MHVNTAPVAAAHRGEEWSETVTTLSTSGSTKESRFPETGENMAF